MLTEDKKIKFIEQSNVRLKDQNMIISEIKVEDRDGNTFLDIEIDSPDIIDVEKVTEAFKILDESCDELDVIDDKYILNVYSKEKGNEQ